MEDTNQKPNINGGPQNLRTYSSDMADAIRENEASVIKIALAEQKKHEQEDLYRQAEGTNTSKVLLVIGGIVLVVAAITAAYFVIQKKNTENAPVEAIKNLETFISYDDHVFIDTTKIERKTDFITSIRENATTIKPGGIKALFLTTSASGTGALLPVTNLFSFLETSAPGSLVRTLSDNYLIGAYTSVDTQDQKPHLFFIFQTNNYNQAFAGLLEWEKTMLDDLFLVFNVDVSGERNTLFEKEFKDILINNKDARILYDNLGADILYYSFVDKTTFIVTDSPEAIKEVNTRILIKKTKPL